MIKVKKIKDYDRIVKTHEHLNVIPKDLVEKYLKCQDYVTIEEKEDPYTLVSKIRLIPKLSSKNILYKVEIIKENLNTYAKEGIKNINDNPIEHLREKLVNIKKVFGNDWDKDYSYEADRYRYVRRLLKWSLIPHLSNLSDNIKISVPIKNLYKKCLELLADKRSPNFILLNKTLALKISKIATQEGMSTHDIGKFLTNLLVVAGENYKTVYADFSLLNKYFGYNKLLLLRGNFILENVQCKMLYLMEGCITLKSSMVDNLYLESPKLKRIGIDDVMTSYKPKFKIKRSEISIRNLITYEEMRIRKRFMILKDKLRRLPSIKLKKQSKKKIDSLIFDPMATMAIAANKQMLSQMRGLVGNK